MNLDEVVNLGPNESVIDHYDCDFPTKRKQLIDRIGKKKVLLIFPQEYKYKEEVDEPITFQGTLYLTNRKLYFVRSKGLLFKRRELILDIDYKNIASVLTQGVIFKDLVVGTEKDGNVTSYTFVNLPAEDVKNKIKEIQGMASAQENPKKLSETIPKSIENEEPKIVTAIKEKSISIPENKPTVKKVAEKQAEKVERTESDSGNFCSDCGYKISSGQIFCGGCGKELDSFSRQMNDFSQKIQEKVDKAMKSSPAMYCANCGNAKKTKKKFCPHCGKKESQIKQNKFCTTCANELQKEDKHCTRCGIKLKK